jgi:hypothetical protein
MMLHDHKDTPRSREEEGITTSTAAMLSLLESATGTSRCNSKLIASVLLFFATQTMMHDHATPKRQSETECTLLFVVLC